MGKTYSIAEVRKAEYTLEPMECPYCGSLEVIYNQYGDFASCQECGENWK